MLESTIGDENVKKLVVTIVAFALIIGQQPSVLAINDIDWYDFPISPVSEKWHELITFEDKMIATQIPDDILANMSTPALLETMINGWWGYGLFTAYDDLYTGLDVMEEYFNGFKEYYNREDGYKIALDRYQKIDLTEIRTGHTWQREDNINIWQLYLLEAMLCRYFDFERITTEEAHDLISLFEIKIKEKESISSPELGNAILLMMLSGCPYYPNNHNHGHINTVGGWWATWNQSRNDRVKTPNQTWITTTELSSRDYTYSERSDLDDYYLCSFYPATVISSSTLKYNCHSHAFYSEYTSNQYWIDGSNISPYWGDGSYSSMGSTYGAVMHSSHTSYSNVRVVWGYANPQHSAIRDNSNGLRSKWGTGPTMVHTIGNSPYPTNTSIYWYYR